jgi:GntR family transcriptional repressor for pyruvate dehydrogenase complex
VSLGYVERRGNRPYVVEHLPHVAAVIESHKSNVRDLFETRRVIEVQVAALATSRANETQRHELSALADHFTASMKLDDFRDLDRRFHRLMAATCGNPLLAEVYGRVLDALFLSTEFHELLYAGRNRRDVASRVERSGRQHRAIATAIVSGERDSVVAAVDEHLDDVGRRIVARLR